MACSLDIMALMDAELADAQNEAVDARNTEAAALKRCAAVEERCNKLAKRLRTMRNAIEEYSFVTCDACADVHNIWDHSRLFLGCDKCNRDFCDECSGKFLVDEYERDGGQLEHICTACVDDDQCEEYTSTSKLLDESESTQ